MLNIRPTEQEPGRLFFRDPQIFYVGHTLNRTAHGYIVLLEEPAGSIYRRDVTIPTTASPNEAADAFAKAFAVIAEAALRGTPSHREGGDWTGPELDPHRAAVEEGGTE